MPGGLPSCGGGSGDAGRAHGVRRPHQRPNTARHRLAHIGRDHAVPLHEAGIDAEHVDLHLGRVAHHAAQERLRCARCRGEERGELATGEGLRGGHACAALLQRVMDDLGGGQGRRVEPHPDRHLPGPGMGLRAPEITHPDLFLPVVLHVPSLTGLSALQPDDPGPAPPAQLDPAGDHLAGGPDADLELRRRPVDDHSVRVALPRTVASALTTRAPPTRRWARRWRRPGRSR